MAERPLKSARRRMAGLSIIELMIAIAIGLFVVVVVLEGYASSASNARVNAQVSEFQTNGRYALEVLKREIRHAALRPMVWDATQVAVTSTAAARNFGCGAGVTTGLMAGMRAWNDSNPYSGTCMATDSTRSYLRGDVLLLRRTSLDPVTTLDTNAPYLRVTYSVGGIFLGGETPPTYTTTTADYRLLSDLYFVNAFSSASTENPVVPALYRLRLAAGGNPTMAPELIASNIEHLQLQFGEAITGGVQYRNADAVTDWTQVNAVRVWLLVRSTSPEPGLTSGSYTMGDVTYTPNDNFRRAVLTTTVDIRNNL